MASTHSDGWRRERGSMCLRGGRREEADISEGEPESKCEGVWCHVYCMGAHKCTAAKSQLEVASGHLLDEHAFASVTLSRRRFALLPSRTVSETVLRCSMPML